MGCLTIVTCLIYCRLMLFGCFNSVVTVCYSDLYDLFVRLAVFGCLLVCYFELRCLLLEFAFLCVWFRLIVVFMFVILGFLFWVSLF